MKKWKTMRLGDFLHPYRIKHIIQDDQDYRQVTISKMGAVSLRGSKPGAKIGRKRQFQINLKTYPNTVLFTRQGLLGGAIGLVPSDIDECVVTENMPMMSVNINVIAIDYLKKLLVSEYFFEKVRQLKIVGSAQKSIHERDLLKVEIDLPDIEEQIELCKKFAALDSEQAQLNNEFTHQQTLLKKLRQQILQEAIEGKLTAQWRKENPDTEPASVLLEKIKAEKAQLVKEKKIKKQKPLPPVTEEEKPFEVPDGWEWCRLGEVSKAIHYGATKAANKAEKDVRLLRITDIQNNKVDWNGVPGCLCSGKDIYNYGLAENDILIARTGGTIGKSYLVENLSVQSIFASYLIRVIPSVFMIAKFFKFFLNSPSYWGQLNEAAWGAGQPNVNGTKLKNLLIPIPPVKEQQTIVAKVEKLLALCDQLETRITRNQAHADQLMQAVLKEAFDPDGQEPGRKQSLQSKEV